jgi:hypothetical protein
MALTSTPFAANVEAELEGFTRVATSRESVRSRIVEAGLIPSVRTTSEDDLLFAAGALVESGVSILEISSTFPGFLNLIECACQEFPDLIVGAGNLFDAKMARRSLDAGAKFLTSDGLVLEVVEIAIEREVVVLPRSTDAQGSYRCVENGRRIRQDHSLRRHGRGHLHADAESGFPADPVRRVGWNNPAKRFRLHSGWGDGSSRWKRYDSHRGHPAAAKATHSGNGAPLPHFDRQRPWLRRPSCRI